MRSSSGFDSFSGSAIHLSLGSHGAGVEFLGRLAAENRDGEAGDGSSGLPWGGRRLSARPGPHMRGRHHLGEAARRDDPRPGPRRVPPRPRDRRQSRQAAKPARPGPGRPRGSRNETKAPVQPVGKHRLNQTGTQEHRHQEGKPDRSNDKLRSTEPGTDRLDGRQHGLGDFTECRAYGASPDRRRSTRSRSGPPTGRLSWCRSGTSPSASGNCARMPSRWGWHGPRTAAGWTCRFCVLASRSALVRAAQLDPQGARKRAELESGWAIRSAGTCPWRRSSKLAQASPGRVTVEDWAA